MRRLLAAVAIGLLLGLLAEAPAALAATWAPGIEATLPANADTDASVILAAISCPSAGNCSAVGHYNDNSPNREGLLLTETAGTWGAGVEATLPANALGSTPTFRLNINSVSCASPGNCSAVGNYFDSSSHLQGLLLTETAGTWATGIEASLPGGAGTDPGVVLNSVSCASAGNCTAVGFYFDSSDNQHGLILTETAGTWATGVEASLPSGASTNPVVSLTSVSCPSAGNCSAVGDYRDTSNSLLGVLLTESSGSWATGVKATLPAGAAASPNDGVFVNSVSCPSAGNCSAAGNYVDSSFHRQGLLLTETAGTWATGVEAPLPAGAAASPDVTLRSISCASAGNCGAVGDYTDSSFDKDGVMLTQTAGTWGTGVKATLPATAEGSPNDGVSILSVSCPSAGDCGAIGIYAGNTDPVLGLLLDQSGGTWAPGVQAGMPASATNFAGGLGSEISCPSAGNCSATSEFNDGSGFVRGLLLDESAGDTGPGPGPGPGPAPGGGPPPPAPSGSTPVLSAARISPHRFVVNGKRVRGRCVSAASKKRSCKRPIKFTVSYQLNVAAQLRVSLARVLPGRLVKGRCVAPKRKNRRAHHCTRIVPVRGALTVSGAQGSGSFTFNGRIGGHTLGAGSYQMTLTPSASGLTGTPRTVGFKIAA